MTKTSPLGMISIAILVRRWNGSKNTERKEFVRRLLQSGDELKIHDGLNDLFKIADEQFKTIELYSVEARPTEMLKSIYTNGVSLLTDYGKESFDGSDLTSLILEAKREIVLCFIFMFKTGHFEQLPMPEFGYELPPEDLASFQKFCKGEEEKLSEDDKRSLGYLGQKTPMPGNPEPAWGDDR